MRLCLIRSIIFCFSIRFMVFSDSENICSGAYTSFLLIPRHLTPTVYTSNCRSSGAIFTFAGSERLRVGLMGGTSGGLLGRVSEARRGFTRSSTFFAFDNSDLRPVNTETTLISGLKTRVQVTLTFDGFYFIRTCFTPLVLHLVFDFVFEVCV